MGAFELKVPPPIVALAMAIAMWFLARVPPSPEALPDTRMLGVIGLAAVGCAFGLSGVVAFRRAKTTVNPLKPASASSLVSGGIYKVTRNPMYVGMLLFLFAWAMFLWSGPCSVSSGSLCSSPVSRSSLKKGCSPVCSVPSSSSTKREYAGGSET